MNMVCLMTMALLLFMKCYDLAALDQYICSLAINLNTQFFEITPVTLCSYNITQSSLSSSIHISNGNNIEKEKQLDKSQISRKRKLLEQTPVQRENRQEKMRAYRKHKKLTETKLERQNRLDVQKAYKKKRLSQESQTTRQARLNAQKAYQKKIISDQTQSQTEKRLNANKACYRKRISNETDDQKQCRLERNRQTYKKRKLKNTSNVSESNAQKQYLSNFENTDMGNLHEQTWAKQNISNFHKSISYFVFKCTVCHEAWPLKSRPRIPHLYLCSRCSRDKKSPKEFSVENEMIPSPVPPQLQGLSQVEEMLIARALPIMRVYIKPGGQRGYSGHCINLPQNVKDLALSLPRYPKDLSVIVVKVKGKNDTFKDVCINMVDTKQSTLFRCPNRSYSITFITRQWSTH